MNRFSIRLLTFLAFSIGLFVVLALLWPLVQKPYGAAFRAAGNLLTRGGTNSEVWFTTIETPSESHDVRLRMGNRAARLQQSTSLSSRRHAYLPTAFLVAITLASPLPCGARLRALGWILIALHAYLAGKLMILPLAYAVHPHGTPPGLLQSVLRRTFEVLTATSAGWMILPLLIWFVVVVRAGLFKSSAGIASDPQKGSTPI